MPRHITKKEHPVQANEALYADRKILHCDLNGFYAAVACLHDPSLTGVPMAVAGDPESRHGIILAKNELAKQYHVQTAETIWAAKRKCPQLVLVPPDHAAYWRYSRLVNEIYGEFTDLVEPFGIDESWLDVTGVTHLFGNSTEIANKIRHTIKARLGLTISVGVSFNKVFAKLGSDYQKPDATTLISRENYRDIVWPLPVTDLLFVGRSAAQTLQTLQIETIGALALADKDLMFRHLGKMGLLIHSYANGIDDSPVKSAQSKREIKSVGNGMTFARDLSDWSDLRGAVMSLADEVSARLRHHNLLCQAVSITIKTPDFKVLSRQKVLSTPTHLMSEVANTCLLLLHAVYPRRTAIRSLTVTAMQLIDKENAGEQLSLFSDAEGMQRERQEHLANAIDHIRGKYGKTSIVLASSMKGSSKPST